MNNAMPESTGSSETEELIQSAIRMLLAGELKNHEISSYLVGVNDDRKRKIEEQGGPSASNGSSAFASRASQEAALKDLFNRHELNGPYNFRYLKDQVYNILGVV